jgi:hypothetical protein
MKIRRSVLTAAVAQVAIGVLLVAAALALGVLTWPA